jgi:hypothetical protein
VALAQVHPVQLLEPVVLGVLVVEPVGDKPVKVQAVQELAVKEEMAEAQGLGLAVVALGAVLLVRVHLLFLHSGRLLVAQGRQVQLRGLPLLMRQGAVFPPLSELLVLLGLLIVVMAAADLTAMAGLAEQVVQAL